MSTRDAALAAAQRGWHVFPCRPGEKRPAVDRWEQRASADPEVVARHWPSDQHNVGIACGPSGLVVIDLDTHGPLPDDWRLPGLRDGRDVLAQLAEWAGQPWPGTRTVLTPTGGWHLYYAAPNGVAIRNSASSLGPSIDVRGRGGYVVAAGSVLDKNAYLDQPELAALVRDGRAYEQLGDDPPVPLPAWICRMLMPVPAPSAARLHQGRAGSPGDVRLRGLVDTVRVSKPGDRTGPLVWAAHRLAEMISDGQASSADAELLVRAAVDAGIRGGEAYARYQVSHVIGARA